MARSNSLMNSDNITVTAITVYYHGDEIKQNQSEWVTPALKSVWGSLNFYEYKHWVTERMIHQKFFLNYSIWFNAADDSIQYNQQNTKGIIAQNDNTKFEFTHPSMYTYTENILLIVQLYKKNLPSMISSLTCWISCRTSANSSCFHASRSALVATLLVFPRHIVSCPVSDWKRLVKHSSETVLVPAIWTVKLCSNKVLQFLTGNAS